MFGQCLLRRQVHAYAQPTERLLQFGSFGKAQPNFASKSYLYGRFTLQGRFSRGLDAPFYPNRRTLNEQQIKQSALPTVKGHPMMRLRSRKQTYPTDRIAPRPSNFA